MSLEPEYGHSHRGYTPSPAEIEIECLKIQATWTAQEKRSRGAWLYQHSQVVVPDIYDMGLTQHLDSGE